jgi:hypothetical protein
MHYVAVNARTQETMGSVPINYGKLGLVSVIVEIIGIVFMILTQDIFDEYSLIFLATGVVYFFVMKGRYRNKSARHDYENSTKKNVTNMKTVDNFLKSEKGLHNAKINGQNNHKLNGNTNKNTVGALGKALIGSPVSDSDLTGFVKELDKNKDKAKEGNK